MADFYENRSNGPTSLGRKGAVGVANDATDFPVIPKGVIVTSSSSGDFIEVLPVENADGEWVSFDGVDVGFIPPYQVRRVRTTTTCNFALILPGRNG